MIQRVYRVRGHVQGVGFRWWTRSQADRLGIAGSVRNLEDGAVEIQARGSQETLGQFRRLLAQGPPGARVSEVQEEESATPIEDGFRIAR